MARKISNFLTLLFIFNSCCAGFKSIKSVSPNEFGLNKATNGVERYEAIYNAHKYAVEHNGYVDYKGIEKIDLEIPANPISVPLTSNTNFKGVVFNVTNKQKDFFLFEMVGTTKPLDVNPTELDNGRYTSPKLNKGVFLLTVEDENPWVENRQGYNYGVNRRDIIYIENQKGCNGPCTTYTTHSSSPKYSYCEVTKKTKKFSNITLERNALSTYKTQLVHFEYQNNVNIENVHIVTPESPLNGDEAISIYNCTNVTLKNINIQGTYSQLDKFGYGIGMNNVWNVRCGKIVSQSKWGVWCCNNAHKIELHECDIDRFDIHCYGRDVACYDCTFTGMGGTFSSVYGDIKYENCIFNDATPYSNRPDFNAYVGFNLYLNNCTLNPVAKDYRIVNLRRIDNAINCREELMEKRLPNVYIENLEVKSPTDMQGIVLYGTDREISYKGPVGNVSKIEIKGMRVKHGSFALASFPVLVKERFSCVVDGLSLNDDNDGNNGSGLFAPNIRSAVYDRCVIENSRIRFNVADNQQYNIEFNDCQVGLVKSEITKSEGTRIYKNSRVQLEEKKENCFIDDFATYDGCTFVSSRGNQTVVAHKTNRLIIKNSKFSKGLSAGKNIPNSVITATK